MRCVDDHNIHFVAKYCPPEFEAFIAAEIASAYRG